ncbi:hypothetical protein pb186bvf_009216 [Paramecium bursaria]
MDFLPERINICQNNQCIFDRGISYSIIFFLPQSMASFLYAPIVIIAFQNEQAK